MEIPSNVRTLHIGVIGGTGSTLSADWEFTDTVETPWGVAHVDRATIGCAGGVVVSVSLIARHGEDHRTLSNMVNHRANIAALAALGVDAIVATTSCGVVDPTLPLGTGVVFDDLYFPDNRLPSGEACTFYIEPGEPGRGHLIAPSHFSAAVRAALIAGARSAGVAVVERGCYAYALGPRFNSASEVRAMASVGATMVSQTAGPEAVLAAELEIPYALFGFGTDYANGVAGEPTPVEVLNANIAAAGPATDRTVRAAIEALAAQGSPAFDTGFVYRFF